MSVAQHVLSEALPYRIRSGRGNWYLARNDLDDAMACAEQQIASARGAEDSGFRDKLCADDIAYLNRAIATQGCPFYAAVPRRPAAA